MLSRQWHCSGKLLLYVVQCCKYYYLIISGRFLSVGLSHQFCTGTFMGYWFMTSLQSVCQVHSRLMKKVIMTLKVFSYFLCFRDTEEGINNNESNNNKALALGQTVATHFIHRYWPRISQHNSQHCSFAFMFLTCRNTR